MPRRFRFRGHTRRIADAVIDTLNPRWADYAPALVEPVRGQLEGVLHHFPWSLRFGLKAGLWVMELGGPLLGVGVVPFTWLGPEGRRLRMARYAHSPLKPVRQLYLALRMLSALAAYGQPEVEARLGVDRRGWRAARLKFRQQLLAASAERDIEPAPSPIGSEGVRAPEGYLR